MYFSGRSPLFSGSENFRHTSLSVRETMLTVNVGRLGPAVFLPPVAFGAGFAVAVGAGVTGSGAGFAVAFGARFAVDFRAVVTGIGAGFAAAFGAGFAVAIGADFAVGFGAVFAVRCCCFGAALNKMAVANKCSSR